MTPPLGRKWKSLLMKVKEESENAGLKLNIQKTKIMASSHITLWQIDGITEEIRTRAQWAHSVPTVMMQFVDNCLLSLCIEK